MTTGTTPSASAASWLLHPTVATRSGCDSITVSPNAWVIVTGNADDASGVSTAPPPSPPSLPASPPAQEARTREAATATAAADGRETRMWAPFQGLAGTRQG